MTAFVRGFESIAMTIKICLRDGRINAKAFSGLFNGRVI